jgi:hypothetical protein
VAEEEVATCVRAEDGGDVLDGAVAGEPCVGAVWATAAEVAVGAGGLALTFAVLALGVDAGERSGAAAGVAAGVAGCGSLEVSCIGAACEPPRSIV